VIKFSTLHNDRVQAFLLRQNVLLAINPQWRVWLFSTVIWILLFFEGLQAYSSNYVVTHVFLCSPVYVAGEPNTFNYSAESQAFSKSLEPLIQGFFSWIIMIFAMMFPLLKRSIQHVATAVRRRNQNGSIVLFLVAYTLPWAIAGIGFMLIPRMASVFLAAYPSNLLLLIAACGFVLACLFSWHESRTTVMMKCELTMPIRIDGMLRYRDTFKYGLTIGINCIKMCWVVMLPLMFASHNFLLMMVVSLIVLIERYYVPHDSKIPGIAWLSIASFLIISCALSLH
jgi:predicted metal-binding membrane protein